jgi:hypothetical protein
MWHNKFECDLRLQEFEVQEFEVQEFEVQEFEVQLCENPDGAV